MDTHLWPRATDAATEANADTDADVQSGPGDTEPTLHDREHHPEAEHDADSEQAPAAHQPLTGAVASAPPAPRASAREARPPGRGRTALVAALVAAVVATGISVPVTWFVAAESDVAAVVETDALQLAETVAADLALAPLDSIADVATAVSPSVAYVEVSGQGGMGGGSAVIIDADGYLLTNAHVVEGAKDISVTLPDGAAYWATLAGSDPTSDLAVLQVEADGLPALSIDPDLEVGTTVVAIGSPFGLEGSVTSGIVSGLDRTLTGGQGQASLLGMIQTDAAINPGNSGGALVDTDGELVGINTAIYSATGTSSGVGFAIPAATAVAIAEQLIATGTVTYAQLGITGGDVSAELATAYDLSAQEGAVVAEVLPGSAAAAGGLRAGDVIVAVDEEPVTSMSDLSLLVRFRTPGDVATLTVERDGEQLELPVTLGTAS